MKLIAVLSLSLTLVISGCAQIPLLSNMIELPSKENQNNIEFREDFSDKKSGWKQFSNEEGSAGYADEAYQFIIRATNIDIFSTYARSYVDSEITANAVRNHGADNNNFGLICRFQDEENFYAGQISSDGYGGIFKIENGEYTLLGHEYMVPVPAVLGGEGENEIRFACVGDELTLTVNGDHADSQNDDTFKSGEFGMIAGTIDGDFSVIVFDDIVVSAR